MEEICDCVRLCRQEGVEIVSRRPFLTFRTLFHCGTCTPARKISGCLSSRAKKLARQDDAVLVDEWAVGLSLIDDLSK